VLEFDDLIKFIIVTDAQSISDVGSISHGSIQIWTQR